MTRLGACVRKNLVECLRDWKITIFAVAFAPAFVLAMSGFLGHGNKPYAVAVVSPPESRFLADLRASAYDDGVPHYAVEAAATPQAALRALESRRVDAALVIPERFDDDVVLAAADRGRTPPRLQLHGDPGSSRYMVAAILLYSDLDAYVRRVSGERPPAEVDERLTGRGKALTEFDAAIPGLVVFALLNVTLTAGAAFLREVDRGTMIRLALSRLRTWEFVAGITVVQAALSVVSAMTALWAAQAVGFRFQGTLAAVAIVSAASSIGVVGVALLTAACLRTLHDLLTVGVIPYFVIMFFSGLMFPMASPELVRVGEGSVRLQDLLPLASSVPAFDRVLNEGAGVGAIGFHLALVLAVSAAWFAAGLWAFRQRHMRLA